MYKKALYIIPILILIISLIPFAKENIECIFDVLIILSLITITMIILKNLIGWVFYKLKFFSIKIYNAFLCQQSSTDTSYNNEDSINLLDDEIYENLDTDKIKPLKNIINGYKANSFFSIALIGRWGSGKSSYINSLSKELEKEKDEYVIININVWELGELTNIISEVKKEFDNIIFELSPLRWVLSFIKGIFIQRYFSILEKYYVRNQFNISMNQTIKNAKNTFSKLLSTSLKNKKIIIFIDELDRIDSSTEIYNIFKMIRYLTSFNNVISVTAVDLQQIESKIKNIDYIHKIFNLKYTMPLITKDDVAKYYEEVVFKNLQLLASKNSIDKLKELLFRNNHSKTEKSVIDRIDNYRVIKNSYNDTYILCNTLKINHENWEDYISFNFIFILNLIKALNYKFFNELLNKETFMSIIENMDKCTVKAYLNNNSEKTESEIIFDKIMKDKYENEIDLLKSLSIDYKLKKNFMRNYDCYIHHEIFDYLITDQKYKDFCINTNLIKEYYNKEITHRKYKDSFLSHLIYIIKNDPENQSKILKKIFDIILDNTEIGNYFLSNFSPLSNNTDTISENPTIKLLRIIAVPSLMNDTNEKVLIDFIKEENDISLILLLLTIENCKGDIITTLFESYLTQEIDENKLAKLVMSIKDIKENELKCKLFKYLHIYCTQEARLINKFSEYFISGLNITNIKKEINGIGEDYNIFIVDENNYYIYVPSGDNYSRSEILNGKELKEKLNQIHEEIN